MLSDHSAAFWLQIPRLTESGNSPRCEAVKFSSEHDPQFANSPTNAVPTYLSVK